MRLASSCAYATSDHLPHHTYVTLTTATKLNSRALMSSSTAEEFITKGLSEVNDKITTTYQQLCQSSRNRPRLLAVTKTKSVEMILHAYKQGQRHFGENYVQEMLEKAKDPLLIGLDDICWHFIGHVQRNKCNNLVTCPHLWAVETVDSERLATALDVNWKKQGANVKLRVFVQVNTSGEASKFGCTSDMTPGLVKYIMENCGSLEFCGLMTIGRTGHDYSAGPNPDFDCLVRIKGKICEEFKLGVDEVELSMGMSSDFEQAIIAGSTSVRVGSKIFGSREPKSQC